MKNWQIWFYKTPSGNSPVEEWLDSLGIDARVEVLRAVALLKDFGIELEMPYVKQVKSKLYELRAKDKDGIYRVLYFAASGHRFVLLHGFAKKTQKTPQKEIDLALKRMKDV
ncbi:MAG TPA: type II toxin-antitoxin system RelE/ParE family toxin [Campylobacterales bacterium]|nr:type II toxin-antitoxin system RelE/ParE family toxin [Campylobacterales bacterium]